MIEPEKAILALIIVVIACGMFGGYISEAKGRPSAEGFIFGAVLGPLGLFLAVLMPDRPRR